MKHRAELDREILSLIRGRDMAKVKELLKYHTRASEFQKLNLTELTSFVEILKLEIESGRI